MRLISPIYPIKTYLTYQSYRTYYLFMSYKDLKSYQNAVVIHDFTVEFIKHYIPVNSRTRDQMEQAARSGKQNITEATSSSKQKPKSEPMLLGVASASLKELLEDYQDYLRQHGLTQWGKDDSRALRVRGLYKSDTAYRSNKPDTTYKSNESNKSNKSDTAYRSDKSDTTYKSYAAYLDSAEEACNAMICLINQTTYLLDNQIRAVERQLNEKGISLESREQKIKRILTQERQREQELNAIIARAKK